MCQQARSRILFLMLVLGAPLIVCAQSHERFSVEPGGADVLYGVGFRETDFKFTADVTDAKCYELDFGDDDEPLEITPGPDGRAVRSHRYTKLDSYVAVMKAWRDTECDPREVPIKLTLEVRVKAPPPAPQPPPSYAHFFVEPSDPKIDDVEVPWADFTFTADVTEAESYELNFGDGVVESEIEPDSAGKVVRRHVYEDPKVYTARMKAWRNTGELIENELLVSVQSPPPPPSYARFSVMPSDPKIYNDIEIPRADFTFTGDVSQAVRYEVDYGDNVVKRNVLPEPDGTTVLRHIYKEPGNYEALIRAWRSTGESVEKKFFVSVQAAPVPPGPVNRDIPLWFWLLVLIAILSLVGWGLKAVSTGTDLVTFEPKSDRGSVRVIGSTTADDSVSMRVRRDAGRVVISMVSGERQ